MRRQGIPTRRKLAATGGLLPSGPVGPPPTPPVVTDPVTIFAGTGGMDQYFDTSVVGHANVTAGLVTQINDLSGAGHHEVPSGTSPNPARQPTYVASDARVSGKPIITYQGEAEVSASRDQTSATGWARAAPPRWIYTVLCQEGPNLGTNRVLVADLTLSSYMLVRPSGSGSSVSTLFMRNGASAVNGNTGITDGTFGVHEMYFSNSLSTDVNIYNSIDGDNSSGQTATAPWVANVRTQQASVADHLIDTDLFPRYTQDHLHFTGAGQHLHGAALASLLLSLV